MIFPKKEILYAPMLGTLGGGSARGWGRGASKGGGPRLFSFAHSTGNNASWAAEYNLSKPWGTSSYSDLLQVDTGTSRMNGSYPSTMADMHTHSDGTKSLLTFQNDTVWRFDADNLHAGANASYNIGSDSRCIAVSDTGHLFVFNNATGNIYKFEVKPNLQLIDTGSHSGNSNVECAVFPGDGYMYFGTGNGYIYRWNIASNSYDSDFYTGYSSSVTCMAFGPSNRLFYGMSNNYIGYIDRTASQWQSDAKRTMNGSSGQPESIVVMPNGRVLWLARNNGACEITNYSLSSHDSSSSALSSYVNYPSGAICVDDKVYIGTNNLINQSVIRLDVSSSVSGFNINANNSADVGGVNELVTDVSHSENIIRILDSQGLAF